MFREILEMLTTPRESIRIGTFGRRNLVLAPYLFIFTFLCCNVFLLSSDYSALPCFVVDFIVYISFAFDLKISPMLVEKSER